MTTEKHRPKAATALIMCGERLAYCYPRKPTYAHAAIFSVAGVSWTSLNRFDDEALMRFGGYYSIALSFRFYL